MKKILFISHDATRTGAPLILLELLKWLNRNIDNSIQLDVLLVRGGAIEEEFRKESSNVYLYFKPNQPLKFKEIFLSKLYSKLNIKTKSKETLFFETIANNDYDLIYANSVVSLPHAVQIKKRRPNVKLLLHVHELNTIIQQLVPDFKSYISYIDKYIVVSNLVKENLITNYQVDLDLIALVYGFGVVKGDLLHTNNEIFTVGASGNAHWRKGDDVFIQVANYFFKNYPEVNIEFIWVGDNANNNYIIENDIAKLGIRDKVKFVGEQETPIDFYRNFDVFLLTSREDPFPLVCIEIASLGRPVICFKNASGTAEVIENGGGFVVPYLDVAAMAEQIMFYYKNPSKMNEDGDRAKQLFSEFTSDKICPLLYEQIASQLNK